MSKFLLCQIGLGTLLFAQSTPQNDHTQSYLSALIARLGAATIRIVDDLEPWADALPCRVILIASGFLTQGFNGK